MLRFRLVLLAFGHFFFRLLRLDFLTCRVSLIHLVNNKAADA